jgi:hypothetical protein
MTFVLKQHNNKIAAFLADKAELHQVKAQNLDAKAFKPENKSNMQAILLSERDQNIAMSKAFIEAARFVLAQNEGL